MLRGRWALGGGLTALIVALLFVITAPPTATIVDDDVGLTEVVVSEMPSTVIESGSTSFAMYLVEGSRIELEPRTRLETEASSGRDVVFSLHRGRAMFDVAVDADRQFMVLAGNVRVSVIGTRFSVAYDPARGETRAQAAVHVERGLVQVDTVAANGEREIHRLGAGQSWVGAADIEEVDSLEGPRVDSGELVSPSRDESFPARPNRPRATELFEEARTARHEGRDADAARHYELLLRRFPRDGHAGLSAFELARIRMDVFGDARSAIEPLERAIAARVFREDAMARLVRAYDESGQEVRCRSARERYLESYPNGLHRGTLATCAE
jgi:transmembrane sensor